MKAPLHLETRRLLLRQPQISDAEAIFERYASDRDVTRFLGWPRHKTVEDTKAFLEFSAQEWRQWPAGPYLLISRDNGRLLGSTGFAFRSLTEAMTGYVLAKDAWGKGFATEALTALVGLADDFGLIRLYAICHPDHRPSQHVLEKCGFLPENSTTQVEFPNLIPAVKQNAISYTLSVKARRSD